METDELREFLKMDFPDYKVDNEKIILLCRKSEKKNRVSKSIIFKLALGLSCVVLVMMVTLLINYNNINSNNSGKINIEPKTNLTMGGDSINTDFFVIDELSIGKEEDPIKIGYKSEYSIFNNNDSLEIEVLIGYFGDIRSTGLFPDDSDLPKIVLRISDNPIIEDCLVEIENFIENYKLTYIRDENDNTICGCKYVFPDEAKGIKVNIGSDTFSGAFGEIRIGLYVGYMYKAETIYYCKNEENGKICISNLSLEDAMKKADYEYVNGHHVE